MIYIDVKGNLGNQMFEYACARKLQELTKQNICLNTCFLTKYKPEYSLRLTEFKLNENVEIEDKLKLPWYVNTYKGLVRVAKGIIPNLFFGLMKNFGIYIWFGETYKELPKKKKKDYYLVGYWQCDKYFEDIRNILLEEFQPKLPLQKKNSELYNVIINTESICVTIRRGDYVTNEKYRKIFFQCDESFFLKGIEKIKEKIKKEVTIIVFSDDIEWVKDNIVFDGSVYYESGEDSVSEKIRLMSSCKHFVVSNSSFSWWAQYLCTNSDKIVCAPKYWYPDKRECDIYQTGWEYIDI